jgi:hypothetical protein
MAMSKISIPTRLTQNDWDVTTNAWRCPALCVPGAVVRAIYVDGKRMDEANYELLADQGLVRLKGGEKPPEALASIELTEPLSRTTEKNRYRLLAIILPVLGTFAGVLATALVPALFDRKPPHATPEPILTQGTPSNVKPAAASLPVPAATPQPATTPTVTPTPPPFPQQFVIKSWTYEDDPPYNKIELYNDVDVHMDQDAGGERVSGVIYGKSGVKWNLSGYRRHKFLGMAYGGLKEKGLGTETYTMQEDRDDIYWGFAVKVECIGPDAVYVRCPAVMYGKNFSHVESVYGDFLKRECERVTLQPPETCTKTALRARPPRTTSRNR